MTDPAADEVHDDQGAVAAGPNEEKWPVGFILTIVMVGGYLAYRLIQGIVLLIDWLF